MVIFDQDICLFTWVSGRSERTRTGVTDPLQVPVDEIEAVEILESMRDVYQLRKPSRLLTDPQGDYVATHELDTIYIFAPPNEAVDVAIIHPFRHKCKPVLFQRHAE